MVIVILGTIEATSMIFLQQSLEISAYEATRVALVPGSSMTDVEAAAETILAQRGIDDTNVAINPSNFQTAAYGDAITVSVSADCSSNSYFASLFYAGRSLTADVTMMKEQ